MKAKAKSKTVTFKTVEEYLAFYSLPEKDKQAKGSKYYHIGEGIAKMACDKATHKIQNEVNVVDR